MTVADYITIGGLLVTIVLAIYNTTQLSIFQANKAIAEHYENTLSVLRPAIVKIYKIPTKIELREEEEKTNFTKFHLIIDDWVFMLIGIVNSISPYLPIDKENELDTICKSVIDKSSSSFSAILDINASDSEKMNSITTYVRAHYTAKNDCIKILKAEMRRIIAQLQQHKFP